MIIAAVALLTQTSASAAEYFPLTPGTRWTYSSTVGGLASNQVDVVMAPVEVGTELAHPVHTMVQGRTVGMSYYRVIGDTVYLVAEDAKKPFPTPMPIFKVSEGRSNWKAEGTGSFIGDLAPFTLNGSSNLKKNHATPSGPRDAFEVKLETTVGTSEKAAIRGKQTAIYAKGIGLVEMVSEQRVNKQVSKVTLKLLKVEQPEGNP